MGLAVFWRGGGRLGSKADIFFVMVVVVLGLRWIEMQEATEIMASAEATSMEQVFIIS